ncbi:MAG: COR domain-containing protein [Cyanobacteria bacterium P01_C01_bin.120]
MMSFAEAEKRIEDALRSNATELNLSGLRLTSIPESIFQLTQLTRLSLNQNWLIELPKDLGKLKSLVRLSLDDNKLIAVPSELGKLSNLTRLDLNKNQLSVVPKEIGHLENLVELYLDQNRLISVPSELGQLSNLNRLSLDQNRLTSIPPELCQLINLTALYLDQNQLNSIPKELKELNSLTELYLHGNEKLGLPDEILGPTWEAVSNGAMPTSPQNILNYYLQILNNFTPLNEAKLILIGFGAVGKTSLVNRLIHSTFERNSKKTEGIQITQWPVTLNEEEKITLHVWDFGGQEIMHSTHQFFLTERSLYLLVLNGRQGHEDEDAEYWLELIQSFGGDSPVIVVLNKITEHAFDVNRGALQQKFSDNIRGFIRTDCDGNIGIDELQAAIKREIDRLEFLRTPFPASWLTIKNKLAGMQKNYISYEYYRDLCQQDGEADTRAQDSLANCLHSLGIALNYKDDPRLRDTHVLNPHWVTNGIYTLLNASELAEAQGEMAADCLDRTLDIQQYPRERHGFLLELMRKFELCFRFADDDNRFLIPDLLDKQQPDAAAEFNLAECLNFRYEYPVLPEGLLPRFIVRTHVLSEHQLRWRTGVILHFEGNRALVKADRADKCVTISIDGPLDSRRRLLAIIRSDFERIHSSFKFTPQELVPVPAHPDVMLPYPNLIVMEQSGLQELPQVINGKIFHLNVRDLLNGVDLEGSRRPDTNFKHQLDTLSVFISYSHKDNTLREELETHLKILQRQGLIQTWSDRCILPGDEWKDEIDDNLNRADIILLLVSADFIASDYCYDIEMKRAMERHANDEAVVIPVVLRHCDWKSTPFSKLGVSPKDGVPVKDWDDPDRAWLNVETSIRQVAESLQGRRFS